MWLSRKNSINPTTTSPRRSPFNRHSFKNIDDLLHDDDKTASTTTDQPNPNPKPKPKPKPSSPRSSPPALATGKSRQSVFHRVCLANQFTRTIASPRSKPNPNRKKPNHEKPKSPVRKPEISSHAPAIKIPGSEKSVLGPEISSHAPAVKIPNAEKRVVVYMTSLGAVRPTFDACRAVRSILQGFRVPVDERDLSMDSSFKDELQTVMSPNQKNKQLGLPRVFIGGKYVGDADELRQLSETGELKRMVEGLPAVSRGVCEGCGDFRFVICSECNGSRKCYREKGGVFRSCTLCNKNGLIRCPTCWSVKC